MFYIWNHCEALQTKYSSIETMIEHIKLTPRTWNAKTNTVHILKYITWTLNLNINLLTFKMVNNEHVLAYKFQNTIIKTKVLPLNSINPFNFILYKKKYYVLHSNFNSLIPCLININGHDSLTINDYLMTTNTVKAILNNEPLNLPFSINIYTSYGFVQTSWPKHIQSNFIGHYQCKENSNIFNIFVSPLLQANSFLFCLLTNNFDNIKFLKKNIFVNPHTVEGKQIHQTTTTAQEKNNQTLLTQENCICDHPETERIIGPKLTSFKPLASKSQQKLFLYENLGKKKTTYLYHQWLINFFLECLGLLNDDLQRKLKLCSELSLIR